jgi:Carboxypeptidase regulatory-like domain
MSTGRSALLRGRRSGRFDASMVVHVCTRIALGAAVLGVGCSDSPTAPSPGGAVTGFTIKGPSTVAPGQTADFTAVLTRENGSSEDVTSTAHWSSSGGCVLRIVGPGRAQSGCPGQSTISAGWSGVGGQAEATVYVLESGTFVLSGTVSEAAASWLSGVTVEILSGRGTGLRATTDLNGRYDLYGAAGDVTLRASREGFATEVHQVHVERAQNDDFMLAPLAIPVNFTGDWVVSVSASSSCGDRLPAEAQTLVYDTVITQRGTGVLVTLFKPTIPGGRFEARGSIVDRALSFVLTDNGDPYDIIPLPDLLERINATKTLGVSGRVQGTVDGPGIDALLSGYLASWATAPGNGIPAFCLADDHRVTLRRR